VSVTIPSNPNIQEDNHLVTNNKRATEVEDSFIPLAALENAFRFWWIIALFIVIGGLGGLVVHSMNPPVYEARAQFSIAIDFVSTGPLTQYEEDLAINTAGHIFDSTEVLQRVVDQAEVEGIAINLEDLRSQTTLERKFSVWSLRVRDADVKVAERLAAIWLNQGEAILLQGYHHAIQAYTIERYIQSQEDCLANIGVSEPSFGICNKLHFTDIQKNLRDAGRALFEERQASRGIFTGLTLGPFNLLGASSEPVTAGRNQYVFLGGGMSLLLSIILIEWGIPKFLG
jgi:hypothetical protein